MIVKPETIRIVTAMVALARTAVHRRPGRDRRRRGTPAPGASYKGMLRDLLAGPRR